MDYHYETMLESILSKDGLRGNQLFLPETNQILKGVNYNHMKGNPETIILTLQPLILATTLSDPVTSKFGHYSL